MMINNKNNDFRFKISSKSNNSYNGFNIIVVNIDAHACISNHLIFLRMTHLTVSNENKRGGLSDLLVIHALMILVAMVV